LLKLIGKVLQALLLCSVPRSLLFRQQPLPLLLLLNEFQTQALQPLDFGYNGSTMKVLGIYAIFQFLHVFNLLVKDGLDVRNVALNVIFFRPTGCCRGRLFDSENLGTVARKLRVGSVRLLSIGEIKNAGACNAGREKRWGATIEEDPHGLLRIIR
jgi:hypothetical protein